MFDVGIKKVENGYILLDRKTWKEYTFSSFLALMDFLAVHFDVRVIKPLPYQEG